MIDITFEETPTHCTCDKDHEEHPCPYQGEICGNDELHCYCCPYCEQQCCREI